MTYTGRRAYNGPVSQESSERAAEPSEQDGALGVTDDQLPDDLRPSDDNPLAQPAGDDVPEDILTEGAGHDSGTDSEDAPASGDGGASDTSPSTASSESDSPVDDDA